MPAAIRILLTLGLGISLLMVGGQLLTNSTGSFGFQALSAPEGTASTPEASQQSLLLGASGGVSSDGSAETVKSTEASLDKLSDQSGELLDIPTATNTNHSNAVDLADASAEANAPPNLEQHVDSQPAANSVASIAQQLQQVDPFIEDLAATNSAASSKSDPSFPNSQDANANIPVVDLSMPASAKTLALMAQDASSSEGKPDDNLAESDPPSEDANAFELLGERVRSGTRKQLTWNATETLSGGAIPTPVLVVHGAEKGPVMCITAGVHGDELNGIETVRRIMHSTKPEKLKGTLVGVPIVNLQGFQRQSRYLPDRRDLNRFFPGHPRGSSASRIAHSFFDGVIRHCDALVDLHTGSFHRTNLPQLRADLNTESVVELNQSFGSTVVLHSEGGVGTLRRAAVEAGIPSVTLEAGEPLRLQADEVAHSVKGINTLLATRDMYKRRNIWGATEAVYYTSQWVRADTGGILFSEVDLGKRIDSGELLGTVTDPVSNEREEIRATYAGRVIGMALNQFVMPGFATFHIGIEAESVDEATDDVDPTILSHDVAFEPDLGAESSASAEPTEE